jgi:hypothetical protein
MPPHINPLHCVFEPACEPLLKSGGRGCAVTFKVALRAPPLAVALIVALNASPL